MPASPEDQNIIEVVKEINQVYITKEVNSVTISTTGVQGPKGATGSIGLQCPTGPQGTTGPQGPAGQGTTTLSFLFEKQVDSTQWDINHNLGYRPNVNVQDYGKINVEGELNHIDANNLRITFTNAVSGYAYLS
jgi:hypothetical protein